jgi:V8-like Glu-specific endopeptidase
MRVLLGFCLVLMTLVLPQASPAQETGLRTMLTSDDSRGWDAVGRLDLGGKSFCTGALIAPNLVLTAAHCLYDSRSGARIDAGQIEFLAGWRGGRATAYRDVRRALVHPSYDYSDSKRIERVAYDLALLELSLPIRNTSVTPFATQSQPRKGAEVGVVSYAHDRAESPSIQEVCHILARRAGMLVLSCSVDFGSSGAPIFTMQNGVPEIVSVVSAKAMAGEQAVSLGTALEGPLADLMSLMAEGDGVFRRAEPEVRVLSLDDRHAGSGAKFVRP